MVGRLSEAGPILLKQLTFQWHHLYVIVMFLIVVKILIGSLNNHQICKILPVFWIESLYVKIILLWWYLFF